jgi:hypothetical protein
VTTTDGATTRRLPPPAPVVLQREAVAGGAVGYVSQYARALPAYIDDITRDFGSDLYERMERDPQISAALSVFKASVLEDGVTLAPAIDSADEDGYDQAVEITDEAARMLDDLRESLDDVLWDLMDNISQGNRLAEQIYELRPGSTSGRRMLQLASLKVKPRSAYIFVVDAFLNVVGILGQMPGQPRPTGGTWFLDSRNPPENLLPTQKFCIATFRPNNGDPRGTSILRPAYDAWWRKRQALVEYVKYLAQFAGPSLWATLPPDTEAPGPPLDFLGNIQTDSSGNPLPPRSRLEDLLAQLVSFRNGTAGAFANGTEIHALQMQGEGAAFLRAIAECNTSIVKAILTQELATEEGEHQARAAAQVHQDVLDTLVRQGKRSVVRMLAKQVLTPWVRYNWGDKAAASLVPTVSLGSTEEVDRAPMINAIANLQRAAYLHPSQLPQIDDMLGLPVRDLTQDELLPDAQDAAGGPSSGAGDGQPPGKDRPGSDSGGDASDDNEEQARGIIPEPTALVSLRDYRPYATGLRGA